MLCPSKLLLITKWGTIGTQKFMKTLNEGLLHYFIKKRAMHGVTMLNTVLKISSLNLLSLFLQK
jgi:hypothetical protein